MIKKVTSIRLTFSDNVLVSEFIKKPIRAVFTFVTSNQRNSIILIFVVVLFHSFKNKIKNKLQSKFW